MMLVGIRKWPETDFGFSIWESGCCWVYTYNLDPGWLLLTTVDLGVRSDTHKPNTSPVTTIIPIIRIPKNCAASINLLAHDPDGDSVICRYAYYGECGSCNRYFSLDQNRCILYVSSGWATGSFIQELVLEDFPNSNIYLQYYDGTIVYKSKPFLRKTREAPKKSEKYWWDNWSTAVTATGISYSEAATSDGVSDNSASTESIVFTTLGNSGGTTEETVAVTQWDEATSLLYTTAWYDEISSEAVNGEVVTAPDVYTTEAITDYAGEASTTDTHVDIFTTDSTTAIVTTYPIDTTLYDDTTLHASTLDSMLWPEYTDVYTTKVITDYPGEASTTDTHVDIFTTDSTTAIVTTYPIDTTLYDDTTLHASTFSSTSWPEYTEWDPYPTFYPPEYTPLSKIPLQFLVEVTNSAPSCTFGDYRPKFLPPTPLHGEKLLAHADKTFQLYLSASAVYESIADFKVSGPPGMTKKVTQQTRAYTRSVTVEWTPMKKNVGEHIPVCFVAETINGYQSELRCVYIVIGLGKLVNTDLFCHENTMTLIISKSADNELYQNEFHLNDPKCLVSSNSSHLVASVAYNTCGTETEETEDHIVFKNIAVSYDNTSVIITRKNGVSIPFNCSFPKKNRVSASFRAHKNDYIFEEAGFGNFTYRFQFFTDGTFSVVNTQYPVEVELREPLYMEIQVSSSVPNVRLFVESCRATPHDNPNDPTFYDIIKNGCTTDSTVVVYPGTRTQYRFGMEAFAFIGDYSEVFMSCTVILCKDGGLNTRCTRGCLTKSEAAFNNRRRRSLASESQKHFISQGPVHMKRETSTAVDVEKTPVNVTTMVIALSVMGTVVLIALMLNIYMKRSGTAGYQQLQSQEC
ncbi:uncharacterized protein [Hyperolius riggenbachi]|uniref:uncharacterized protein n=1 Tax=Hyperolius riggenbachi TaxID=752182 RepID=UPI0035A2DA11